MNKLYFTITGTHHHYGKEFIEPGMEGLSKIGYVANSPYTVLGDSVSAGRLYD